MRASLMRTMSVMPFLSTLGGKGILPTSAMPGKPLGPQFFSTSTQVSSTSKFSSSIRAWKSSMFSNTTARPVCTINSGEAALGLMTAPRSAKLPRSTAMPALSLKGSENGLITRAS